MIATVIVALLAGPVAAQDLAFTAAATESCLAAAGDLPAGKACIGAAADACMETPDGGTTVGMGFCLNSEYEFWDARLNTAYQGLMALEDDAAANLADLGSAAPSSADALRDMQRAWIAYRDAACLYEVSQWGGGTGGGPAGTQCMMQLAGEQALMLEDRLADRAAQ